ncbi:Meiotically up-regulated protein [Lachnellula hyalina]|uniref:Meiotically up-regulated protein n=1 Tax=Lachnellula hyalina TaxID=1316788 RepID=A0A8H8QUV5_9HELO|nr:Meiotically up-regulated protein [Lachnellula hyalina]TVY23233.1 Meiotically up-regulated protein [Lachnellula hyalina]
MAPSATQLVTPVQEVKVKQAETHVHGAEDKSPLEAISQGPMIHPGIPTFSSHAEHRKHILIHTAAVFRDFSRKGFTEGMSGHISVRDPEFENYIWMNPLGKHFGLMTAGDLICFDIKTGKVVGGNRAYLEKTKTGNSAGFLIHSEIHKARPDIHAVCHAHTNAGRAWSVFSKGLDMLNQDITYLYDSIAVYSEYGGIVFAEEEGRNIARALGTKNKVAILLNHGLLSTGSTVDEAGFMFGLLDRGCAIQLQVEQACAGNPSLVKHVVSDEEAAYNFKMASEKNALYAEAQPDLDYEFAMAGPGVIEKGVEDMKVDHGV